MADAAAARESGTVRTEPVVAGLRNVSTRGEHRARGEREQRQSCDDCFHFRLHHLTGNPSVRMELANPVTVTMSGFQSLSREAGLKKYKNVPENEFAILGGKRA
jgi:DNA-binding GntR family transcriptional regulator